MNEERQKKQRNGWRLALFALSSLGVSAVARQLAWGDRRGAYGERKIFCATL